MADLRVQILELIAQRPGLKARDIADSLGVSRRDVNQKLYGPLRSVVTQDAGFGWHLTQAVTDYIGSAVDEPSVQAVEGEIEYQPEPEPVAHAALAEEVPVSERVRRVRAAVEAWTRQLIDLSGRNQLLYYRTLKVGTLELTDADVTGVERLLAGRSVMIGDLMPATEEAPDRLDDALKRIRTIQRKALAWFEERGVQTLYLAWGMATWDSSTSSSTPAAPILLRPIEVSAQGASKTDFKLKLTGDWEINDTLLHALATEFRVDTSGDQLLRGVEGELHRSGARSVFRSLEAVCTRVPGFQTVERLVVGTFSYTKLPMVRDLEEHIEELAESDLIAAIAGDSEAQAAIHESRRIEIDPTLPDRTPPSDEFLILDADSSQNAAINAVVGGQPLIVQGPPGTGKSQTIANLIATLAARGKRVLFVAEKRAAIEAVVKRLDGVGLKDLVMDLHGGVASKRQLAADLAQALTGIQAALQPNRVDLEDRLERSRNELNGYVAALHRPRDPWGLSVRQILDQLGDARLPVDSPRLPGPVLEQLEGATARDLRSDFERWVRTSAPILAGTTPWGTASIDTPEDVDLALAAVDEAVATLMPAVERAGDLVRAVGLSPGRSLQEWTERLELIDAATTLSSQANPEIWDLNLEVLRQGLAPGGRSWLGRVGAQMRRPEYREAKRGVRGVATGRVSGRDALRLVEIAQQVLQNWRSAGGETPPEPPPFDGLAGAVPGLESVREATARLEPLLGRTGLDELPVEGLYELVRDLSRDRQIALRLPLISELRARLDGAGLGPLLDTTRDLNSPATDDPGELFDRVWLESLYLHLTRVDRTLGAFDGEFHSSVANSFRSADREHVASVPEVVRRRVAENALPVRNSHPAQDQLVKREANKKSRHLPLRRLFEEAPDVMLALRPCWVMSPLVVSQTMPAAPIFDVVVFDEASQVLPADAVPALLRGRQAVVAGDRRQLPPTTFFASSAESDDLDDDDLEALTEGFESVLDVLDALLRSYRLTWHYRSEDERLIAFSNHNIYDASLTTFPGATAGDCLAFELIPHRPGVHVDRRSNDDEVARVVDLMVEHARTRPTESLGVIGMSIHHADRIDAALLQRLRFEDSHVAEFFDERKQERAFVKNLERVQGDERDAIILTVGYAKLPDGRLPYRFGPLNQQGGERRLNVAVTRARRRLTLVSSFSDHDMEAGRSPAEGVELLRRYLRYAASGGSDLAEGLVETPLNPFEVEVKQRLERTGLTVIPQHGVSGYRIDFAVAHPSGNGRYVLAVEADGASYHSSYTARDRDRLRQEVLERLGWRVHRIWSTDWFNDSTREVAKVVAAYEAALSDERRGVLVSVPEPTDPTGPDSTVREPATTDVVRERPMPRFTRGLKISEYSPATLGRVIDWIRSDGRLRTDDELVELAMRELGFTRKGARIVEALQKAIRASRGRF